MYYPVSALVTLFANVLQNPQDARARSDLRLMNVVVEFLQTVQKEDDSNKQDTASVQRMLAVCGEFHRIAKLVLDKAESENVSRRKRKNDDSRHSVSYPHKRDASSSPRTNIPQATSPRTETASPPTSVLNPEINSQVFLHYPDNYLLFNIPLTQKSALWRLSNRLFPFEPSLMAQRDEYPRINLSRFSKRGSCRFRYTRPAANVR